VATVYVNVSIGNDANAGTSAAPWKNPLKADASATAGDTVNTASGTYLSTDYAGAPTNYNFTKLLTYSAQTNGGVLIKGTNAFLIAALSSSLPTGSISFTGYVFDGADASQVAFQINDPAANTWALTQTSCTFKGGTVTNWYLPFPKGGTFSTVDCTVSGSPGFYGMSGDGAMAASSALTITHTRPVFNLTSSAAISGIYQNCTATTNAVSYTVNGATGTISTTGAATSVIGVKLQCPGATIKNTNALIISAPDINSSSAYGLVVFPNLVNISNPSITDNNLSFQAPGGYGIMLGDGSTTATGTLTGGTVTGNRVYGKYYTPASLKTPHGIAIGRATTVTTFAGNYVESEYVNYIASIVTSGTGRGNISRDAYGCDFYAKGCTAWTWTGNTAIQTGKYPRINLGPFSIDSQSGVNTTATTFSFNTFICAETDFTRVGSLANISVNQNGTYTGNTYIVPDTWDTDTTPRFFVGGIEGGRSGATGYTIDQWVSGTAGSVNPTNGTGTIAISSEVVIRMPIAAIRNMVANAGGAPFTYQNGNRYDSNGNLMVAYVAATTPYNYQNGNKYDATGALVIAP